MSHAADLPLWAAILTALLVLIGAGLALAAGTIPASGEPESQSHVKKTNRKFYPAV